MDASYTMATPMRKFKALTLGSKLLIVHLILFMVIFAINTGLFLANKNQKFYSTDSKSPFDALYFTTVTHTTIGYGDIYPTHVGSKLIMMLHALLVFVVTAGILAFEDKEVPIKQAQYTQLQNVKPY